MKGINYFRKTKGPKYNSSHGACNFERIWETSVNILT